MCMHKTSRDLFNEYNMWFHGEIRPGLEVIKPFSCSTELSTKYMLLINVKMPTFVGICTFISMINTTSERLKAETSLF